MSKISEQKREEAMEYFTNSLNKLVDHLFQEAFKQKWTWQKLSEEAGVCGSTIDKLGARITKSPHYRTVELIASALGYRIDMVKGRYRAGAARTKLKLYKLPREPRRKKLKVA